MWAYRSRQGWTDTKIGWCELYWFYTDFLYRLYSLYVEERAASTGLKPGQHRSFSADWCLSDPLWCPYSGCKDSWILRSLLCSESANRELTFGCGTWPRSELRCCFYIHLLVPTLGPLASFCHSAQIITCILKSTSSPGMWGGMKAAWNEPCLNIGGGQGTDPVDVSYMYSLQATFPSSLV